MKKLIAFAASVLVLAMPLSAQASGGGHNPFIKPAHIDLNNHAAIQRGAKYFTNYCMGCHSAKYVRYQLLKQVGLTEDQIKENLIFDGSKVGGQMKIAMPTADGAGFFGAPAPDLTLEARLRGSDWIYSYLTNFYGDDSRPMGVNNTVFPNVGMPNILWELEGVKAPVYQYAVKHDGHIVATFEDEEEAKAEAAAKGEGYKVDRHVERLELIKPGKLTPAEFDQVARDLTAYLTYIAEPVKLERQTLGVKVVLFLVLFSVLAYLMKKEWWKDIH